MTSKNHKVIIAIAMPGLTIYSSYLEYTYNGGYRRVVIVLTENFLQHCACFCPNKIQQVTFSVQTHLKWTYLRCTICQ